MRSEQKRTRCPTLQQYMISILCPAHSVKENLFCLLSDFQITVVRQLLSFMYIPISILEIPVILCKSGSETDFQFDGYGSGSCFTL